MKSCSLLLSSSTIAISRASVADISLTELSSAETCFADAAAARVSSVVLVLVFSVSLPLPRNLSCHLLFWGAGSGPFIFS